MIQGKRVACVIPARLKSTRFPQKVLALLGGIPLLQRVWERALSVPVFDEVVFAVDAPETASLIQSFGGRYLMTSEHCPSGSDRLAELKEKGAVSADIWVNWQADEPFLCEEMITDLLQSCGKETSDLWTLRKKVTSESDYHNLHMAKVVCDAKGYALYFSRSPIPCYRDVTPFSQKEIYKHVGLYAYTAEALCKIRSLSPFPLESAEQLEQLRFLAHGLKIRVHDTQHEVFGIDLPEHLVQAEAHLRNTSCRSF